MRPRIDISAGDIGVLESPARAGPARQKREFAKRIHAYDEEPGVEPADDRLQAASQRPDQGIAIPPFT